MLYNQAQLSVAYLLAYQLTAKAEYARIAQQTIAVSPGWADSLQKAQGCCQSEVRDSARGRLKFYPE
ncbi:hypothetical protein BMR04_03460 [Methylococcaceae bacterium HT3]|nr:hypothetical protein BMR04_03460 [Methylococcaceae bacterium HT3]